MKTYVSAIKKVLTDDGYIWNDKRILLTSLTKACKLINDRVLIRLPINCNLLELILYEVQRFFSKENQYYLEVLYKAVFALAYYGLMRVGEVTASEHVLRAQNVHIATNKNKLLMVLYTSKTHGRNKRPQKIKITAIEDDKVSKKIKRHFCPFKLLRDYIQLRGSYDVDEQFFIFRDRSPLTATQARSTLKQMLTLLGLN